MQLSSTEEAILCLIVSNGELPKISEVAVTKVPFPFRAKIFVARSNGH